MTRDTAVRNRVYIGLLLVVMLIVMAMGSAVRAQAERAEMTVEQKLELYKRWLDDDDRNRRITAATKLMEMGADAAPAVKWMKVCADAEQVQAIASLITRAYMHIEREAGLREAPPPDPKVLKAALAELTKQLTDAKPKVRHTAIIMLGKLGAYAKPALEDVRKVAREDEHPTIRAAAANLVVELEKAVEAEQAEGEAAEREEGKPEAAGGGEAPGSVEGAEPAETAERAKPAVPEKVTALIAVVESPEATDEAKLDAVAQLKAKGADAEAALKPLFREAMDGRDDDVAQKAIAAYLAIRKAVRLRDEAKAKEAAEAAAATAKEQADEQGEAGDEANHDEPPAEGDAE